LLQYEAAADKRRDAIREMLDELTEWILQLFILDGELPEIDQKDFVWEWVSASLPWIDPLKEAQANIALINANLESEIHVLKQQGREFEDVVAERKTAMAMIKEAGLQAAIANAPGSDPNEASKPDEPQPGKASKVTSGE
jgi:capsid protein